MKKLPVLLGIIALTNTKVNAQETPSNQELLKRIEALEAENKKVGEWGVTPYGWVRTDYILDSRQSAYVREYNLNLYPLDKKPGTDAKDINASGASNFLAITSRVGMKLRGPNVWGAKVSGVLEGDFSEIQKSTNHLPEQAVWDFSGYATPLPHWTGEKQRSPSGRHGIQHLLHKPEAAKISQSIHVNDNTRWKLILLVFVQVIFVTMVYGPIAAFLVEMFPVRIRYTSMSLPYHIGNGIFGGLLPAVATYLVTTGKESGHATWYLEGLWYPIGVASVCFIIGVIYLKNSNKMRE